MRPILPLLALALAGSTADRAQTQEPQTSIRIEADASGAPCVVETPDTGVVSLDDMIRQLQSVRPLVEVTVGRPLPGCPPLMPPLPGIARGHGTQHFDIQGWHAGLGIPVEELGALFDEIHAYVTARTGLGTTGLIPVMLQPANPGACPHRGRAWHLGIELFVDESWSREQWLGVLAHELGHVLQHRESPGVFRLGGLFTEGYASWAAGRYWTDWQGYASLRAAVRDYLEREVFLDLSSPREIGFREDPGATADCIAQRDILYTEWASLVEHLVERHGREDFYARADAAPNFVPGRNIDYSAIFGRNFDEIEADWLEAVRAQR